MTRTRPSGVADQAEDREERGETRAADGPAFRIDSVEQSGDGLFQAHHGLSSGLFIARGDSFMNSGN